MQKKEMKIINTVLLKTKPVKIIESTSQTYLNGVMQTLFYGLVV